MVERPHGYTRYHVDKCRCYVCALEASEYRMEVTRRKKAGTWRPYVDARPSREYMELLLSQGYTFSTMQLLSGINHSHLWQMINGRSRGDHGIPQRVRPSTEHRILSMRPNFRHLPPKTWVPNHGTARRIQALCCLGWAISHQARMAGRKPPTYYQFLVRPQLYAVSAVLVDDVYHKLQKLDPADYGATGRHMKLVRNLAVSRGWAPPHCWDDDVIDDPTAYPEWTGACGSREGYNIHRLNGIPFCQPCRDGEAVYRAEVRARNLARRTNLVMS